MERLLADAQKISGVEYNIDNLADVYEAIHVIQEEMGVTGTTATEASSTFSGSMAAMKSAATNLLANLTLGEDIGPSLSALGDTVFTFVTGNLLPMVGNALQALPEAVSGALSMAIQGLNLVSNNADSIVQMGIELVTGIGSAIITALPYLAEAAFNVVAALGNAIITTDWAQIGTDTINSLRDNLDIAAMEILGTDGNIIQSVFDAIIVGLPSLLESGVSIVTEIANGIMGSIPALLGTVGDLLSQLLGAILAVLPDVLESGVELIGNLADGLSNNAPAVMESVGYILSDMIGMLADALPDLLKKGVELIGSLAEGLLNNLPSVLTSAASIIADLLAEIASHLPDLLESGISLIGEMAAGLIQAIPDIVAKIPEIISGIVDEFTSHDWGSIGGDIIGGIAKGITGAISDIIDAVKSAAKSALDTVKNALGIASPSKVMRDEVGKFIPAGIAVGIKANSDDVANAVGDLSDMTTATLQSDLRMDVSGSTMAAQPKAYGDMHMSINVYGAEGQDIHELAKLIMEEAQHEFDRREAALT